MTDPPSQFTLVFTVLPLVVALALVFVPLLPSMRGWGTTNPGKMQLAVFVFAWFLSWLAAAGIAARLMYVITYFYFDTTFGLVSGVTREIVQSYTWKVLVEVWLRQLLGWLLPSKCFSTLSMTCQLGNVVGKMGSLGISPAMLAFLPALLISLLARWVPSRRSFRAMSAVSSLVLILVACAPRPSQVLILTATVQPTLTETFTSTSIPLQLPTDSPTPTPELHPSDTPSPPVNVQTRRPTSTIEILFPSDTPTGTPSTTPTLACERETAFLSLSTPTVNLKVGESIQVTATVKNDGCLSLGLPQYRLYIQSDGQQSILIPENPEPVVHSLAVAPGQSDSAEFDLTAAATGQVTLTASVSYEVHIGYPGPAYWGYTGTREPLLITIEP